jgi:large subunit ribosomal protein L18
MALNRAKKRKMRQRRVRRKLKGSPERPRLCVYKSGRHIYAQVIDDIGGKTLVAASTLSPELKAKIKSAEDKDAAKEVGKLVAEKSRAAGVSRVVFDRNGFLYHGKIKTLADAAREQGLEF